MTDGNQNKEETLEMVLRKLESIGMEINVDTMMG
jgi:hypothetical protein